MVITLILRNLFILLPMNLKYETMKQRFILFSFMLSTAICAMSQGIPLRFTAQYENGAYHPFDTVLIENLSRGWTYALAYPDTTFVLGGGSSQGIDHVTSNGETGLKVYPNPFAGRTKTILQLSDGGNVKMHIIRVDGSIVTSYSGTLSAGSYQIGVQMSKPQVAFLCVETGGERHVAKLVNSTTGDADKIEVHQIASRTPQPKDPEPGDFEEGDTMRFTAISIIGNTRTMSEPVTEALRVGREIILIFETPQDGLPATEGFYENGSSHATFSVAANKQVRFSRGNLQYQASTNTWRFAEHQYETMDSSNTYISETYDGWIDLFGWGTSGWNSGAAAYQPWASSENGADYVPNGNNNTDLTGDYANADWGVYNAISNGGNEAGMWRTLTYDEMRYLVESRPDAASKLGLATVNDMPGLIILPDNWILPENMTFSSARTNGFESNVYSATQWTTMEIAGALFLPAAGWRIGSEPFNAPDWTPVNGGYWTSTHTNVNSIPEAHVLWFNGSTVNCYNTQGGRQIGASVRLVMDYAPAVPAIYTKEVTNITSSFAISGGTVTFDGGEDVTSRGVCWSTEHNPTINNNHTDDGSGTGIFTSFISGMAPSTTYYARAYATNSIGTAYGHEASFTTESADTMFLPTVVTMELTSVTSSRATYGGNVVDDGGNAVTARGVCWGTSPSPTIAGSHTTDGNGTGEFTSTISNLTQSTTYYIRAYATNSLGTAYGEEMQYTTVTTLPGFGWNGASFSQFSVAAGNQVRFARGNLQYQAATDTWRFAEHQYDYIGEDNQNISDTNSGWIDLFGWGTSGWNSGAAAYQPWEKENDGSLYGPNSNLTGENANADWGIYNRIWNGGYQTDTWRTPTYDEWNYLLFNRSTSTVCGTANARYAKAMVNGIKGLIVFPDSFIMPSGLATLTNINVTDASFNGNSFTLEQWSEMEMAGALFLPIAGERSGTQVNHTGYYGEYWTSTNSFESQAQSLIIGNSNVSINAQSRSYGFSVRLIKEVPDTYDSTATLPTVSTMEVMEIGDDYAICGGNVTDDGGDDVSSRGICWGTNPTPTINNLQIRIGCGLGEYSGSISGLSPATTYYVRAYATNNVGTAYGDAVEFTTAGGAATGGFDSVGASIALFSVAADRQVRFSQGNLQYQASTNTWRFAENQYDHVGEDNQYISDTNSGWIDLFGWGTSGWNSGAAAYQPWSTSTNEAQYYSANELTGDYSNADWGVYNAIINGGNQAGMWRTLTYDEWRYLVDLRENATSRRGPATVAGNTGYVFLPDNWTLPTGLEFDTRLNIGFAVNTYTAEQWAMMEANGAIFLPIACTRSNRQITCQNSVGYWSSSKSSIGASCLRFTGDDAYVLSSYCYYGLSVRLVMDATDSSSSMALPTSNTSSIISE